MNSVEIITEETWNEFGDRKRVGRIDFVVDTVTDAVYGVPKEVEHKDFVPTLPSYEEGTSRFVPLQLRMERGEVHEILIGASSYEAATGVKHTPQEMTKAYKITWYLLTASNLTAKVRRNPFLKPFLRYDKHGCAY